MVISGRGVCLGSLQFLGQVASEYLSPSAKPGFIFIYLFHKLQGDLLSGNRGPCSLPESLGLPVMQGGLLIGDRIAVKEKADESLFSFLDFRGSGVAFFFPCYGPGRSELFLRVLFHWFLCGRRCQKSVCLSVLYRCCTTTSRYSIYHYFLLSLVFVRKLATAESFVFLPGVLEIKHMA